MGNLSRKMPFRGYKKKAEGDYSSERVSGRLRPFAAEEKVIHQEVQPAHRNWQGATEPFAPTPEPAPAAPSPSYDDDYELLTTEDMWKIAGLHFLACLALVGGFCLVCYLLDKCS